MPETEKELQDLKVKIEKLDSELRELSDEELDQVAGGGYLKNCPMTASYDVMQDLCVSVKTKKSDEGTKTVTGETGSDGSGKSFFDQVELSEYFKNLK